VDSRALAHGIDGLGKCRARAGAVGQSDTGGHPLDLHELGTRLALRQAELLGVQGED
jgi:hypothetical protein